MIRQIGNLTKVLLCNFFGINQMRYSKDKKEKIKFISMFLTYFLVIAVLAIYAAVIFYSYVKLDLGEVIPSYMYLFVSVLIFAFTYTKAGNVLFAIKDYDMLISMPVSKNAIVISRFVSMYISSLLASFIATIPGIFIYGYYMKPGIVFYLISIVAMLILPLLPLTVVSIIGAIITAVSSRFKHKSLIEITLMVLFVVMIFLISILFGKDAENMSVEQMQELVLSMNTLIKKIYAPAGWYYEAINGSIASFLLLIFVPIAVFSVFAIIVGKYFQRICSAINAVSAKNNYKMGNLKKNTVIKTLWKKELKRYFSSSLYVMNTIIIYVMVVIMSVVLLFMGKEQFVISTDITINNDMIDGFFVLIFGGLYTISSITACSISMEGNTFWLIKTLPVRSIDVYNVKILLNLTVAAPFYIISTIINLISIKPDFVNAIMLVIVPLCYLIFSSVLGIVVNIHFPKFDWKNEVEVVKQGISVFISMIIGIIVLVISVVALFLLGDIVDLSIILGGIVFALLICTYVMHKYIMKKELINI